MIPLQNTSFKLDFSGVAGFFGGDEAIAAMTSVHMRGGTKWLGWYNFPGSAAIARKYGELSGSRLWRAFFPGAPGAPADPTCLFDFYGKSGPKYVAAYSGTKIADTGHVGNLFLQTCLLVKPTVVDGKRRTLPGCVTVVRLHSTRYLEMDATLPTRASALLAGVPILSSAAACVTCAIFKDWFCFAMLVLGILSSGLACFVIGSGTLKFVPPKPAPGSPKGDGILLTDREIIVVLGKEEVVNSITKGRFMLRFSSDSEHDDTSQRRYIGLASLLLTAQFLLQLLLIPQGTLFGQMLFLLTLAISWAYNSYLSSFERHGMPGRILMTKVLGEPVVKRYTLGTRTAVVVFAALVLQPPDPSEILELLPDTETWKIWKRVVRVKLEKGEKLSFDEPDYAGVADEETGLLKLLYDDAHDAYLGYLRFLDSNGLEQRRDKDSWESRGDLPMV
jgi:hypothetical protein